MTTSAKSAARFGFLVFAVLGTAAPASATMRAVPEEHEFAAFAGQDPAPAPAPATAEEDTILRSRWHFQAAAYLRLNGLSYGPPDNQTYGLMTWSLNAMTWDRKRPAWGGGVRLAMDDVGTRYGPMALRRWPLGSHPGRYWQLSGGVYLAGTDNKFAALPGWFIEAEAAPSNLIALTLACERTYVEYRDYSVIGTSRDVTVGDTGWYAGIKLGQGLGALAIGALFVAGLAAAASLSHAGW